MKAKDNITQLTRRDILNDERNRVLPLIINREIQIEGLRNKDQKEKIKVVADTNPDGTAKSYTHVPVADAIVTQQEKIDGLYEKLEAIDRLLEKEQ